MEWEADQLVKRWQIVYASFCGSIDKKMFKGCGLLQADPNICND